MARKLIPRPSRPAGYQILYLKIAFASPSKHVINLRCNFIFNRHPPSHSSPYPVLGPGTPAIEQLRQYANIDSQREALSGLLPHSQPPFAYHMAGVSDCICLE